MKRLSRRKPSLAAPAAAAAAACLVIAALRGCMLAKAPRSESTSRSIAVFSADTGRTERMPLEEYILGVVGAEMPASFPLEALKAQAVAARTYAVRRMENGGCKKKGADVCTDSSCCQSYKSKKELRAGFGGGRSRYMDKLQEAVYSTAGEIAVYGGEPIEALYHSAAGGRTEDCQNVFGAALPYLVGVSSPGEEASAKYRGEKEFSPREFARAVNGEWPMAKLRRGRLKGTVEIVSRYGSGQVKAVRLGEVTASGRELRGLLRLNSADFTIDIGDNVVIHTTGYGHGVGMSQYGARAMALEGRDYREILRHYYTGIDIVKWE